MNLEFRPLSAREMGLLEKLLEPEFEGRDELRSQLAGITAQELHDDGTLKLRCTSGSPNPTNRLFITEGMCSDADGNDISVLLHADRAGFMCMLEILKYDPSPIINPPAAKIWIR